MHPPFAYLVEAAELVGPAIPAVLLALLWRGLGEAGLQGAARARTWLVVAVPLVAWYLLVAELGRAGAFRPAPQALAPAIPAAILLPLAAGLYLLFRSRRVTDVLDATSPAWLVGVQVYRVFGAVFLSHWAAGQLPGTFALPAGAGDVLVGALAIPVALWIRSGKRGALAAALAWNALGIADLISAVALGFLTTPGRFQMLAFEHPNELVGVHPLVMIPAFAVPLSLILHGLSLRQLHRASRSGVLARHDSNRPHAAPRQE